MDEMTHEEKVAYLEHRLHLLLGDLVQELSLAEAEVFVQTTLGDVRVTEKAAGVGEDQWTE